MYIPISKNIDLFPLCPIYCSSTGCDRWQNTCSPGQSTVVLKKKKNDACANLIWCHIATHVFECLYNERKILNVVEKRESLDRRGISTQRFFLFWSLTSCAVISEEVMVNHFLPGLRCLHADMEQLSPEHEVRRHACMRSLSCMLD